MPRLHTLTLIHWPDLTLDALARLAALPGLRRLNLSACPDSDDSGLRRVRELLPTIQVRRVP